MSGRKMPRRRRLTALLCLGLLMGRTGPAAGAPNPPDEMETYLFLSELDGPFRLCNHQSVEHHFAPSYTITFEALEKRSVTVSKKDLFRWWRKSCSPDYSMVTFNRQGQAFTMESDRSISSMRASEGTTSLFLSTLHFLKLKPRDIASFYAKDVLVREADGPIQILETHVTVELTR